MPAAPLAVSIDSGQNLHSRWWIKPDSDGVHDDNDHDFVLICEKQKCQGRSLLNFPLLRIWVCFFMLCYTCFFLEISLLDCSCLVSVGFTSFHAECVIGPHISANTIFSTSHVNGASSCLAGDIVEGISGRPMGLHQRRQQRPGCRVLCHRRPAERAVRQQGWAGGGKSLTSTPLHPT